MINLGKKVPVTIIEGFVFENGNTVQYIDCIASKVWANYIIKQNGNRVVEIGTTNFEEIEKFNFFKENVGNKVALIFEKESKKLLGWYVVLEKKDMYILQGQLTIANNDHGVASDYFSMNLEQTSENYFNKLNVVGIELKKDDEYYQTFKEFVNTGKNVSITFEKKTHKILNFIEIK